MVHRIINKLSFFIRSLTTKWENSCYYKWYILRKERYNETFPQIQSIYNQPYSDNNVSSCVVCIYDGRVLAGGLADRLRGILSVYAICKEKKLDFRLFFKSPFDLNLFLVPNAHNWNIDREQIDFSERTKIVYLDSTDNSQYQNNKQYQYLKRHIKPLSNQTHVYTNASFSYDMDYASLFLDLFQLSPRFEASLNERLKELGKDYISISARFLNLLGDFKDTMEISPLSAKEKQALLTQCRAKVEELHKQYPSSTILVNSDSQLFLKEMQVLPYTTSNQGYITHIDTKQKETSYEQYEKTFLDFFTIAHASEIFLLKGYRMMNSGYPYAASRIKNRPYKVICF